MNAQNKQLDKENKADLKMSRFPFIRPKNAGTLLIIDKSLGKYRVLMGKRSAKHKFMPGKFVFPGGRVDPADSRVSFNGDFSNQIRNRLSYDFKGNCSEAKIRALALSAVRETYEETGVLVGKSTENPPKSKSKEWKEFFQNGVEPDLSPLSFICRAITPPKRPRRFDARFFVVKADEIVKILDNSQTTNELLEVNWLTFDEARQLDLARITRIVIEELDRRCSIGWDQTKDDPVPYYFMRHNKFDDMMIE